MDTQQAYEAVRRHFAAPSASLARTEGGGSCYYRDPDDWHTRCAVGVLIPDDEYEPAMEDNGVTSILDDWPLQSLREIDEGFLKATQEAHDGSETAPEFVHKLDLIAWGHGLLPPVELRMGEEDGPEEVRAALRVLLPA